MNVKQHIKQHHYLTQLTTILETKLANIFATVTQVLLSELENIAILNVKMIYIHLYPTASK